VTDKPKFVLTIESTPCTVPAINRLRRLCKALGRAYSFRVLKVEELPAESPSPPSARVNPEHADGNDDAT
jgi:hypothetical protein